MNKQRKSLLIFIFQLTYSRYFHQTSQMRFESTVVSLPSRILFKTSTEMMIDHDIRLNNFLISFFLSLSMKKSNHTSNFCVYEYADRIIYIIFFHATDECPLLSIIFALYDEKRYVGFFRFYYFANHLFDDQ